MDIYVLDGNLTMIGLVDTYKSCIWSNRYYELGDCELYLAASTEMMNLLAKGNYLMRMDDGMVCKIKRVELDTSAEDGNYLIITGYDVKSYLDQRVVWGTMTCYSNVEVFLRKMVSKALVSPSLSARQLLKPNGDALFKIGNLAGFTDVTTEQISYSNIGEVVRDHCKKYGWGYRVLLDSGYLWFQLYQGTDRTSTVIFSDDYENLSTTTYVEDETNLGNVALVAGEGEGSERARNVSGYAESVDRYEIYVDARDISQTITYEELTDMYPLDDDGGQGYISGTTYVMNYLNIQIVDSDQLTQLRANYPTGQEITVDGVDYYQVYSVVIADLPSSTPADSDNVTLRPILYEVYLLTRGYEKLAEYGATTSFEGTVDPTTTFTYKQDYFLGDVVTVQNEYGISVSARIVEVVEVADDNGYSIEPKFEYFDN